MNCKYENHTSDEKVIDLIFVLGLTVDLFGDTWANPELKDYFSENRLYMLRVFPTEIPDNYWKWKAAKPKRKDRFSAKDTTIVKCHAILFRITDADTTKVWEKKLINMIAPVTAIVSNEGNSVVTFDNWGSLGYGIDVMVVYNQTGRLVKRYKLEDFSPIPINDFLMSISSLRWRCGASYIDSNTVEVCFKDQNGNIKKGRYFIHDNQFKYEPFPLPKAHTHPQIIDEEGLRCYRLRKF